MNPADELKKISTMLQQHLNEEEELPPWEEVLEPSVLAYYQRKTVPKKEQKEPKIQPEIKKSQEIKRAPQDPKRSQEIIKIPKQERKPENIPIEPPLENKVAPQPKVNHEMFKGLCQELFPDLKFIKSSEHNQPQVVIFSPANAKDEVQLFLQKIGEAIKNRGIEMLITSEASVIIQLQHLKLILVERSWMDQLPDTKATLLPLDELETMITHNEKKKILWQQIRTILKI